jgi:PKD repeat protein
VNYPSGVITDCYWDVENSGQLTSVGGATGKTTVEMKTELNFIGWDFTDIWSIIENETYPQFVIAYFSGMPLSGTSPLAVQFTDESYGSPTSWDWDFGDGSSHSTDPNPLHVYALNGTYTVTLSVVKLGLIDTYIRTDYIDVAALIILVADFSGSPKVGSLFLTVQFVDRSSGPVENWSWDFGDGFYSTERNPVHYYPHPGIYTVTLTVSNTELQDIEIKSNYIRVDSDIIYDIAPVPAKKAYRWGNGMVHKREVGIEIKRIST